MYHNPNPPVRIGAHAFTVIAISVLLGASFSGCKNGGVAAPGESKPQAKDVSVPVLSPQRVDKSRTTTQPATVHAFYRAEIHAKAAGYVSQLKVDIGQRVTENQELAIISVPEMGKRRERYLATIERLVAEEKRAEAEQVVANENVNAFAAMVTKAKADVNKTTAQLTASKSEYDRVKDLVERQSVAKRLLDEALKSYEAAQAEKSSAEAEVLSAEANLNLARAKAEASVAMAAVAKATTDETRRELDELDELMKYATLTAPFAGVVIERHVDPGDLVRNIQATSGADGPLFVVAQIDPVRIRVAVPERDASLASIGDTANISLQALGGTVFEATVSRTAGALDESTRTMMVEIDVPNPDGNLLPGMFGQATINLEPAKSRIMLPANAIRFDETGKSSVYVVNGSNQIDIIQVKTGLDTGEQIEITSGLTGSERVVGPTLRRLKQGQKVRIQ
jgi:HlyD family secretion protein